MNISPDLNTFKKAITEAIDALILYRFHPCMLTRQAYLHAFRRVALDLKWHDNLEVSHFFHSWMETEDDLALMAGFFENHTKLFVFLCTRTA